MEHCVICGCKFIQQSDDLLCAMCHIKGCNDNDCKRCIKMAEALLNFVYKTEEEEND